ncbi:hypothetical protein SAMN02949497_3959 [Methylomagnum ishizawai]|uniref:Uncharacterized protein n=1 Tax=Methylomagnum ishizawai TaxID=1760988 RepID=A0A1Y6D0V3_9GAMM|nr:hypothetical protein SAMN02949497_3959 [Methylomagnum ishizawai]
MESQNGEVSNPSIPGNQGNLHRLFRQGWLPGTAPGHRPVLRFGPSHDQGRVPGPGRWPPARHRHQARPRRPGSARGSLGSLTRKMEGTAGSRANQGGSLGSPGSLAKKQNPAHTHSDDHRYCPRLALVDIGDCPRSRGEHHGFSSHSHLLAYRPNPGISKPPGKTTARAPIHTGTRRFPRIFR